MFKLIGNYQVKRSTLKCDYIRYSPSEKGTKNTASFQIYNNTPRENSVISLLNIYLELIFARLHAAIGNRYADSNDKKLSNSNPIALFSSYKLTTTNGNHLEDIVHAHIVSLM